MKQEPTQKEVDQYQENIGNYYDRKEYHEENMNVAADKGNTEMYNDQYDKYQEVEKEEAACNEKWDSDYGEKAEDQPDKTDEKSNDESEQKQQELEKD